MTCYSENVQLLNAIWCMQRLAPPVAGERSRRKLISRDGRDGGAIVVVVDVVVVAVVVALVAAAVLAAWACWRATPAWASANSSRIRASVIPAAATAVAVDASSC